MYYDISSSGGDFLPTDSPYKYRNIGQDWVTSQNGEQLRIVNTEPIPNENGECFVMGRIIDGVGSEYGFTGRSCNQLTEGKAEFFRCFNSKALSYSEVQGTCTITSTDDITRLKQVRVYPNPSAGNTTVDFGIDRSGALSIMDISGYTLSTYRFGQENTVSLTIPSVGLYLIQISFDDGTVQTHKQIVTR